MSEYYLASKVNYIIVAPATFFTVGFSRTRLKFYAHFLRDRKIDTAAAVFHDAYNAYGIEHVEHTPCLIYIRS